MSRSFPELRADLPDVPNDDTDRLIEQAEAWLEDPSVEPPGGFDAFYERCSLALMDLIGAGATVNSLLAEWSELRRPSQVFLAGRGELQTARGLIAEAKAPLEKAVKILKTRHVALVQADRVAKPKFWQAAPASVMALREIDNALELWRDDESKGQAVLDRINDAVASYYDEGSDDA